MKKCMLFLLMLFFLTGTVLAEEHTHFFDQWDRDLQFHWRACACGEAADGHKTPHNMPDGWMCKECGSEILLFDDGTGQVYNYNEDYDILRNTSYEADGRIVDDYRYVYERNENGQLIAQKTYWNGFLCEEYFYRTDAFGEAVPVYQLGYDTDGSTSRNDYDTWGNVVKNRMMDPAGNITFEEVTEYVYDDEGTILYTKALGKFTDGESFLRETNQYGDSVFSAAYDVEGYVIYSFRNEYKYDEEGNLLWSSTYNGDRLTEEIGYQMVQDEFGVFTFEHICTFYEEDGTKTVTEYNVDGEEVSVVRYDAQGVVLSQ